MHIIESLTSASRLILCNALVDSSLLDLSSIFDLIDGLSDSVALTH